MTTRVVLLAAGAWVARPAGSLAGQGMVHLVGPTTVLAQPVAIPVIAQRLRALAERYRAYAAVPRVVLVDVAFPKDSVESAALSGYALLLVTALSHKAGELPLRRVYVRSGDQETELANVAALRADETAGDSLAAQAFGRYRADALYLLPIALHAQRGAILVDFAAGRSAFVVSEFDGLPDAVTWLPTAAPTAPRPGEAVLLAVIQREYPGFIAH
jgi:hypothetical protein